MDPFQNGNWLSDYLDEFPNTEYERSSPHPISDQRIFSACLLPVVLPNNGHSVENNSSKKRFRVESSADSRTKACREKLRRDRLNDRFLELCLVLMPKGPANVDKAVILEDAIDLLKKLRIEAKKLQEKNQTVRDSIRSLKVEKKELRRKKLKLKAEKERIKEAIKGMNISYPFAPQPAPFYLPVHGKTFPSYLVNYPPPMWQWAPPTSLDTSHDHVFNSPVA